MPKNTDKNKPNLIVHENDRLLSNLKPEESIYYYREEIYKLCNLEENPSIKALLWMRKLDITPEMSAKVLEKMYDGIRNSYYDNRFRLEDTAKVFIHGFQHNQSSK